MADIYGTNGSDTVTGTNGDDNIHGGDAIPGGSDVGDDTLNGGEGNDRLWGEGGNDILYGDDGDDFLFGDIGDDTCNGGAGNDTIEVTRGNDIVNGGTGIDLLTFFEKSAGITISLAITVAQDSGDGIYTIHNIENLTGGYSNDTLTGNDGDNVIQGGQQAFGYDGNDWLDGGAGNDTLIGNRGTDTLIGGLGDDTLTGGEDDDTYILDTIYRPDIFAKFRYDAVVEYTYGGIDTVKIQRVGNTEAYTLTANVENGLITGTETFTLSGNELANQLTGNGSANTLYGMAENDVLDGGVGNDTMHGGNGNDTYYIDNIGDKVIEANGAGTGTDEVRTSVSFSVVSQFVENMVLLGADSISAIGNNLDNTITGNSGNNAIDGRGGIDVMEGGLGNDTYYVDNVLDKTIEANGAGTDTVYTTVSKAFVDQFVEVIRLSGSGNINTTGNSLANTIVGNGANNGMNGREGADTLTGGYGNDTFVFNTVLGAGNVDIITDFKPADDTIQLDDAIFTSLGTGVLSANAFRSNATGLAQDADDRIIYNSANGQIYYDSNGNGAGGNVLVADLDSGLGVTNVDFLVV